MTNSYTPMELHAYAAAYKKIKTRQIVDGIYTDFRPWQKLSGFARHMVAPAGRKLEFTDDPAMVIGEATFQDQRVCIIAQQTPANDAERSKYNYGLIQACGYGLAYNMMRYAEKHQLVLHTWIDTIGGDPFESSAQQLQSWLIAKCQQKMISLKTRSISTVVGRGGSGGAVAIQLAHKRFMLSLAEFSVIAPEGCAAIVFRTIDPSTIERALQMLRPTADAMREYGIIDDIIEEPDPRDPQYLDTAILNIREALFAATTELTAKNIPDLHRELVEKIEHCARSIKPTLVGSMLAKTKHIISRYRPKKTEKTSPEVLLYRAAIFNDEHYHPSACNDERDPKEDPQGAVIRPGCHQITREEDFKANFATCPHCGRPATFSAHDYIKLLLDQGTFSQLYGNMTVENIQAQFWDYSESRKRAYQASRFSEALVAGKGKIFNIPVCVAISNFSFMGGSLGSVVGEKFRLIAQHALKQSLPLISISVSGGARMQEGTAALYQMPKTISAILKLNTSGIPFISVLGHPTTGGTLASYALLGDINIAEKKATIEFTGHRVVKLTSGGRYLNHDKTTAEFYAHNGAIHAAVERSQLKSLVYASLILTPWHTRLQRRKIE